MAEVHLHVRSLDDFFADATRMVRDLDRNRPTASASEIAFESMDVLLKYLTPNRWRLLQLAGRTGPSSIRALAKSLDRDYRGVHSDVTNLLSIGLMERSSENLVSVPWSKIVAEMSFDATA